MSLAQNILIENDNRPATQIRTAYVTTQNKVTDVLIWCANQKEFIANGSDIASQQVLKNPYNFQNFLHIQRSKEEEK
jgi:hypothetical protein